MFCPGTGHPELAVAGVEEAVCNMGSAPFVQSSLLPCQKIKQVRNSIKDFAMTVGGQKKPSEVWFTPPPCTSRAHHLRPAHIQAPRPGRAICPTICPEKP